MPEVEPFGSGEELGLLTRHRPILRYDRQYDYRAASVLGAVENPGNVLRRGEGEVVARAGGEPPLSLELLASYPEELEPREDDCISMAPDVLGDARRMEGEERYAGHLMGGRSRTAPERGFSTGYGSTTTQRTCLDSASMRATGS